MMLPTPTDFVSVFPLRRAVALAYPVKKKTKAFWLPFWRQDAFFLFRPGFLCFQNTFGKRVWA